MRVALSEPEILGGADIRNVDSPPSLAIIYTSAKGYLYKPLSWRKHARRKLEARR